MLYRNFTWQRNDYVERDIFSKMFVIWNWRKYIFTYVVRFLHRIAAVEESDATTNFPSSKFTSLLSRDKLSHPLSEIFELSCVLYCYYKNLEESCADCLLQAACFSLKMQIEIKSWENFQIFWKAFSFREWHKVRIEEKIALTNSNKIAITYHPL